MTRCRIVDTAYGYAPASPQFVELPKGFKLRCGEKLDGARIAYEAWGRLSPRRDNAVLILSGLSASAHAASHPDDRSCGWWEEMVGPGKPIDTDRFYVICINMLGSCFGSTGPASINPLTNQPYRLDFPPLCVEDIADSAVAALRALGIGELACLIGASMGGMTALSMLSRHPGCARFHINISSAARATAFAIALRSLQRQAVCMDPNWCAGKYGDPKNVRGGMMLARMLGTLSYRSAEELEQRFGRNLIDLHADNTVAEHSFDPEFEVAGYLSYQAKRFVGHYDPNSFLYLGRALDRFDLAESMNGDLNSALAAIRLERALVIGVESDMLFPIEQQEAIAEGLGRGGVWSEMVRLDALQGHDTFLIAPERIGPPITRFLYEIDACRTEYAGELSA